jgi:pSer/pThr/pTyr-binding forkhead associated (FHA) protein
MAIQKKMPASEKRGVLYLISGKGVKDAVKLRRDATILGREKGDVLIEDTEVSASHCQIQNINDVYHVFDMNSTNGTFVNKERILKARLSPGDVITIGTTALKFELEDERAVRHLATIFKASRNSENRTGATIVDTLIENELRTTQSFTVVIKATYPDKSTEELELRQRLIYIGRASSFGKFDQDSEMSRKHLLIKINDLGQVFLEDQGSTNGVFVNGRRLRGMFPIGGDDEVKVGGCVIRVASKKS